MFDHTHDTTTDVPDDSVAEAPDGAPVDPDEDGRALTVDETMPAPLDGPETDAEADPAGVTAGGADVGTLAAEPDVTEGERPVWPRLDEASDAGFETSS